MIRNYGITQNLFKFLEGQRGVVDEVLLILLAHLCVYEGLGVVLLHHTEDVVDLGWGGHSGKEGMIVRGTAIKGTVGG